MAGYNDHNVDEIIDPVYLDRCYLETFTSGAGQEVLEDLWLSYFERPLMNPDDHDPATMTVFREGQRSVILQIRACMRRAESGGMSEVITQEDLMK